MSTMVNGVYAPTHDNNLTKAINKHNSIAHLFIYFLKIYFQNFLIDFQDKYLHTNCLAALANMSSQFTNLHSFVAQKVIK